MSAANVSSIVASLAPNGSSTDVTYVPQCSSAVIFSDYVLTAAASYDPRHWQYYKDKWHLALAGWICAGVCAAIALMLLIWLLCFCACACCCGWSRQRRKGGPLSTANDFKTPAGPQPYGAAPSRSRWRPRRRCCGVMPVLCIAMLLIAIGLATWALVEGVRGTHHQVDKFWAIEQNIRDQILTLENNVLAFFGGISSIQQAVSALAVALQGVDLNSLGLSNLNISGNIASDLANAASTLDSVVGNGDSVAASLNQYGVQGLDNARANYQPESLKVQNTYIPVILGVEYALLVALAILATVLLVLGRLCAGGFFLLLYWIWLTVVMFSGPGVYHGAESVAADTCLYVENFAYRVATSSHLNAMTKAQVTLGFDYYLGREGNTTAEELAAEIYGVNLTGINLLGSIPDVNSTVDFFGSTAGIRFLGAIANLSGTEGLNATGVAIVADAPAQLNQTYAAFDTILSSVNRSAWTPLYLDLKNLLCCGLANDMRSIWISWTAASAAAGVLGLLLILRLYCSASDYRRGGAAPSEQFIMPGQRGDPVHPPPTVPVQADTGAPLAAPLNTSPPSWDGAQPLPPQRRSLADRVRAPFGGRAKQTGASGSAGPYSV